MSLYPVLMKSCTLLPSLLYTLLPDRLESVYKEWNSSNNVKLNFRSPYSICPYVPDKVKEVITNQNYDLSPSEKDPVVITAFNLVEEFTTPGSNHAGGILIACANGKLEAVKHHASKIEESGQQLMIQTILITALLFKHIDIAEYCVKKGAVVDGDVHCAAWTAMSVEAFRLLFPLDVFSLSKHPERLDSLLWDCFMRYPMRAGGNHGVSQSEVKNLAEFLFSHGAKVRSYTAVTVQKIWPDLMPLILSHVTEAEGAAGVLLNAISEAIGTSTVEYVSMLLSRSTGAKIHDGLLFRAASRPEMLKLLVSHGGRVSDHRLLHEAAICGNPESISFLLDNGIPVNSRDTNGWFGVYSYQDPPFPNYGYALHYAVYTVQPDAVRVLLDRGADPNLRGLARETAFDIPVVGFPGTSREKVEEVKRLLALVKDVPTETIPAIIRQGQKKRTELVF